MACGLSGGCPTCRKGEGKVGAPLTVRMPPLVDRFASTLEETGAPPLDVLMDTFEALAKVCSLLTPHYSRPTPHSSPHATHSSLYTPYSPSSLSIAHSSLYTPYSKGAPTPLDSSDDEYVCVSRATDSVSQTTDGLPPNGSQPTSPVPVSESHPSLILLRRYM